MAVLSKEDFRARIAARVGESQEDEDLSFLEDMTDTYESLERGEELETLRGENARLLADNDSLRKRYKERFTMGNPPADDKGENDDILTPDAEHREVHEVKTIDELFFK